MQFVREHSCDQVQGYFFSRPISTQQFENLLRSVVVPP
jgi:EAL domain-containing protein (putative c-di-GMP-specific phosphodiesterase class I)